MSLFKKLTKLERVNENIDAKQKSVDQLGATENPRKIKVLDTDRAPAHPFDSKLVGEESKKKSLRNPQDNPCWKGYKPVGTKQKDGRTVPNCVPKEGVAEGSVNDYFKRRKDEEDRIAGIKAPAKRSPRQTDYAKRRAQEKKVDQGVAEGSLNEVTQGVEHSEWADNVKDAYYPTAVRIVKKRTEDGRHVKSQAIANGKLVGQYNMNTGVGTFTSPKKQGVAESSYNYQPDYQEEFDGDTRKIFHYITLPNGKRVEADFSSYQEMSDRDVDLWIKLGMPTRQGPGPLTSQQLERMAAAKGLTEERNEMDTPEFRAALASLKKKAQQGPMKTVFDPKTRKYKVVPVKSDTPVKESAYDYTIEDVISKLKDRLGDYLTDVAQAVKKDTDLKEPGNKPSDTINAVKTLVTDDGHEIRIHGNEDDGFRITIKNKDSKTKFANLKEAEMAARAYCARRKNQVRVPKNFENEK